MATTKDLMELIKQARSQGWDVHHTKGDHYKWVSPSGAFFFSGSTLSDHRALKNIKRDLRVNGFIEVTRKQKRKK
jgi:hypothetical protein